MKWFSRRKEKPFYKSLNRFPHLLFQKELDRLAKIVSNLFRFNAASLCAIISLSNAKERNMQAIKQFINEQSIVFQILIYVLSFSYAYNILINFVRLFQIWKGIIRLNCYIIAYSKKRWQRWTRKRLLNYFPIISRHTGIHSEHLKYDDDYPVLYQKSVNILSELLSEKDRQRHRFRASFNPILGIKTFVTLPMVLLSWFGIRPNKIHEPVINIIGIAAEVLLAKILESHYTELESFAKSICDIIRDIGSNIP